ncbi:MAG: ChrR family anti-sigma-E factor [Glaciecola sp.]
MIKFHPNDSELADFAEGNLPSVQSLFVSAHCDMCSSCKHKVTLITDNIASMLFDDQKSQHSIQRDFISMFEGITSGKDNAVNGFDCEKSAHRFAIPKSIHENTSPAVVSIEGRDFHLPATLSRFVDRIGGWSHLVGKIWQAPVDIGEGTLAQFVFMEKGGTVPEHTHKGNEYTLVIDGKFEDNIAEYGSGDYMALSKDHTHAPISNVDEGCLVFCVIDKPLQFTTGWAKLINPLSTLYFNANT